MVVADRRGRLGPAAPPGLGAAAALRRHAGARRPALARRPDDVPGLPGDAARAAGRARRRASRSSRTTSSGFDRVLDLLAEPREMADHPGHADRPQGRRRGPDHARGRQLPLPGQRHARCSATSTSTSSRARSIALVGRSGAGKTTLCNLIARFYDPTAGDDPARRHRPARRSRSRATAACWGSSSRTSSCSTARSPRTSPTPTAARPRAEVERAARVANADEFIAALPDGYDTLIGERGVRLSGGQRAAAGDRPRRAGRPEDLHPRRGDQQPRHRERAADPARASPP